MPETKATYKCVILVGLPGSGKHVIAEILNKELGYGVVVMSDVVKEEVIKRGLEPTRENFRRVGLELRDELGPAAVALLSMKKIEEMDRTERRAGHVIDGARNIEEIDAIKNEFGRGAILIAVYASKETRYRRLKQRGRMGFDRMSYAEFLKEDRREVELFDMGKVFIWADRLVVNEGTIEDMRERALSIVLGEVS